MVLGLFGSRNCWLIGPAPQFGDQGPPANVGLTVSEQLVAPLAEPEMVTVPPDEESDVGVAVVVEITGSGPLATVADAVAVTFPAIFDALIVKT